MFSVNVSRGYPTWRKTAARSIIGPVKSLNAYRWWVGGGVGVWFLASVLTLNYNGLFFNEGIYWLVKFEFIC